jgi:hypothetical protein
MARHTLIPLVVYALMTTPVVAHAGEGNHPAERRAGAGGNGQSWPVATSLRSTVTAWARRQGWPAPQFLTDADWPVDVPGSISGSLEHALRVLAAGFGGAAAHPRIVIAANHVIVVSELGDGR